jgi:NAD(P)-dependent dehydrogenase (short-subunit alcohol dehydrogenase family)
MSLDSGGRPEELAGVAEVDLSGTTALVTGSTNGIGRAAALALGRLGAEVLVHGRDADAGAAVVSEIEASGGTARFLRADFEEIGAVTDLAATVQDSVEQLDILCNNAGGFFDDRQATELGVDRAFHINHLAHYRLTADLLDTLGPDSRVVTTASIAHRGATLNLDRLMNLSGLSPMGAYCRSKLANIQFANELARRLKAAGRDVTSNSLHPGIIPGSEFGRSLPVLTPETFDLFELMPVTESVADGAATLVYLAASPDVEGVTGSYFTRCREIRPAPAARDRDAAVELWARSADLLDIEEPLAEYATSQSA